MKKIILKVTTLLTIMFLGMGVAQAASYTISAGSRNLSKGSSTKLTIKGSDVTGRFNIKSSNPSVVSISEDRVWIENGSYSIKLSALSVGTSTITVTPSNVSDSSGKSVNLSSKTITITVSLPREKSTDNTLKSLSVDGYQLTPEFNKDTLDYEVTVQEGTKSINVSATANSNYAKVSGTGDISVTEGINNISIVVKAESGTERIYNLVVNVIDKNPINVTIDNTNYTVVKLRENYTCPELFSDSEIVIDNIPIPACTNEVINYTLVGLKKEDGTIESFIYENRTYKKYVELVGSKIRLINEAYAGVVDGLQKSTLVIDDFEYQAYKFSDSSKYYVVYGMNVETGDKGLYVYDSVNKTFSGYDTEYIDYLTNRNQIYLYVIIAFGAGLFLSLICIVLLSKNKKKSNKKIDNETKEFEKVEQTKKDKKKENKNKLEDSNTTKEKKDDKKDEKDINKTEDTQTYYLFESNKKNKRRK